MTHALALLLTPLGRIGAGVLGLVAFWLAFAWHYEQKGAEKAVARMEKAGDQNAAKAEAARRGVDKLPDDRLRDRHFRD